MSSDTAQAHVGERIASMLNATPPDVLGAAHPTPLDRFSDMKREIRREVTKQTYQTMTGGLEFVAACGENQHTLVVTMPPAACVLWTRLDSLVRRAGRYAGFVHTIINPSAAQLAELSLGVIEKKEVAAELQEA